MKKSKRKKYTDPEMRFWSKIHGPAKTHNRPIIYAFPRLNNRNRITAASFAAAGYPMAVCIAPSSAWTDVHNWCMEQFSNRYGKTYCWTGEKFWFQNESDKAKFIQKGFGE